VVTAGFAVGSY